MTKRWKFLALSLVASIAVGFAVDRAIGQVTMQFPATRDAGIQGFDPSNGGIGPGHEQMSNAGDAGQIRPNKGNQNNALMDFDTAAMEAFLNSNPGTATWTLNIFPKNGPGEVPASVDMGVLTVESTNDWAEGNGEFNGLNWNWSEGTAAATYFYAQTVYTGLQFSGTLDPGSSLEWIDPDSGPYTFTQRDPNYAFYGVPNTVGGGTPDASATTGFRAADPTPEFTNSAVFTTSNLVDAFTNFSSAAVVLDSTIINAMITDENNRGLRFGPLINTEEANWRIFDRNISGGALAPFLEVTITPSVGQDGDFDGDLDVDGNDFLVWQREFGSTLFAPDLVLWENNYGTPAPLAAATGAVPEPSSIMLLAFGSAMMVWRRSHCCAM